MRCDVAIAGGGPAGSTVGALIRKYNPFLEVAIFEAERFPRDHVGESQLPMLMPILAEMGVWDKVEAADFPIKIGGTYIWGKTDELWDIEFIPGRKFRNEPRPAQYAGQRTATAFQVDRGVYDKILLDHAASLGCKVFEEARVKGVGRDGDRITELKILKPDGETDTVTAKHYVDASGESGVIRKAMEVEVDTPTALKNIAIYDYWQDADWAVSLGTGGTRIQVLSIGWGWLWFIPISPIRTSIGLVLPADHYKAVGKLPEELYLEAIAAQPLIKGLVKNAKREGLLKGTKDWSFIAKRLAGENWFLAGDSSGFADPILSAGLTLAQSGAHKVAYSILELERGALDPCWVKAEYDKIQRIQLRHHVDFADYWYTANGRFTDLQEYCSEIAKTAGLDLNATDAWRWLATGGFAVEDPGIPRVGTYRVGAIKCLGQLFEGEQTSWTIMKTNVFKLNLEGAAKEQVAIYGDGRIRSIPCYRRNNRVLPLANLYSFVFAALKNESDGVRFVRQCLLLITTQRKGFDSSAARQFLLEALEAMIEEGWVTATLNPERPLIDFVSPEESTVFHRNRDNVAF